MVASGGKIKRNLNQRQSDVKYRVLGNEKSTTFICHFPKSINIFVHPIIDDETVCALKKLKYKMTCGPDGIPFFLCDNLFF